MAGEHASQGKGQHRRPSSQLKAPRPRDVPEFEVLPAQPVASLWALVVWHFVASTVSFILIPLVVGYTWGSILLGFRFMTLTEG